MAAWQHGGRAAHLVCVGVRRVAGQLQAGRQVTQRSGWLKEHMIQAMMAWCVALGIVFRGTCGCVGAYEVYKCAVHVARVHVWSTSGGVGTCLYTQQFVHARW
jgi:hypothetical protein